MWEEAAGNHQTPRTPLTRLSGQGPLARSLWRATRTAAQAQTDGLGLYGSGATAEGRSAPGVALQGSRSGLDLRQASLSPEDRPGQAASEEKRTQRPDGRGCVCPLGDIA